MADLSVHAGKRHGADGVPRGCRSCGRGMFRSYHQSDCHVFGKTASRTLLPHPFRSVENDGQTVFFHGGSAYHQPGDDSSFQQPGESSDPAKTSGIWLQCFRCPEYFGILTGMTMSIILFPSVLTNSFSVLLLPAVSEAHSAHNHAQIARAIKKQSCTDCFLALFLRFCFWFSVTGWAKFCFTIRWPAILSASSPGCVPCCMSPVC